MSGQRVELEFNRALLHHFINGEEIDSDDPRNPIQKKVNEMLAQGWKLTFDGWRGDRVLRVFER